MKISFEALAEIKAALLRYEQEIDATELTDSSKHTYFLHAQHFVRWLEDDFEPGSNKP